MNSRSPCRLHLRSFLAVTLLALPLTPHQELAAATTALGNFVLIDDFDQYEPETPIHSQGRWRAEEETNHVASGVAVDPLDPGNRVLSIGDADYPPGRLGHRETINIDPRLRLAEGSTATYFFRIAWVDEFVGLSIGMSDVTNPISDTIFNSFTQFETQLRIEFQPGFDRIDVRNGGSFGELTDEVESFQWYNIWMVVDNAADTSEIHILGGNFVTQTQLDLQGLREFGFRNGQANNDLTTLFIATGRNTDTDPGENIGPVYIDDIYVDPTGRNLANPIPEPSSTALVFVVCAAALGHRRRSPPSPGTSRSPRARSARVGRRRQRSGTRRTPTCKERSPRVRSSSTFC